MDNEGREKVALFRFGVISPLVARKGMSWGEREELIRGIVAKSWEIPGSPRSFVSRSTVLHWLTLYERAGGNVDALQPRVRCDRGTTRALDAETEAALVALKRELPAAWAFPGLVDSSKCHSNVDGTHYEGGISTTQPSRKTRPQPSTSVRFLLSLLSTVLMPLREPMIAQTRPG